MDTCSAFRSRIAAASHGDHGQQTYFDILPQELLNHILGYMAPCARPGAALSAQYYERFTQAQEANRNDLANFRCAWPGTYLESAAEALLYKMIEFRGTSSEFERLLADIRDRPDRRFMYRGLDLKHTFAEFELEQHREPSCQEESASDMCEPLTMTPQRELDSLRSLFNQLRLIDDPELQEFVTPLWTLNELSSLSRAWALLCLFPNIQSLELSPEGALYFQLQTLLDIIQGQHSLQGGLEQRPSMDSNLYLEIRHHSWRIHKQFEPNNLERLKTFVPVNLLAISKRLEYIIVDPLFSGRRYADKGKFFHSIFLLPMFFLPNIKGISGLRLWDAEQPRMNTQSPSFRLGEQLNLNHCPLSFLYRINLESLIGTSSVTSLELHDTMVQLYNSKNNDIYSFLHLPKALKVLTFMTNVLNASLVKQISMGLTMHKSSLERLTLRGDSMDEGHLSLLGEYGGNPPKSLCEGYLHEFTSLKYLFVNFSLLPTQNTTLGTELCPLPPSLETLVLEIPVNWSVMPRRDYIDIAIKQVFSEILPQLRLKHELAPALKHLVLHVEIKIGPRLASLLTEETYGDYLQKLKLEFEQELGKQLRDVQKDVELSIQMFLQRPPEL